MIGWEYPPHNSGGLGVACHGMTKALSDRGSEVFFTLPYHFDPKHAPHMRMLTQSVAALQRRQSELQFLQSTEAHQAPFSAYTTQNSASLTSFTKVTSEEGNHTGAAFRRTSRALPRSVLERQVHAYAADVSDLALPHHENIDVIHAHDWMSFPAASRLQAESGRHMIAHVHSTEFDRSPNPGGGSEFIHQTEYDGLQLADTVVAVSAYTKRILIDRYNVDPSKIRVVHNGIDPVSEHHETPDFAPDRPVVSFMGRLTSQKGAHQFLDVARRVLQHKPETLFILAGNGDLYQELLFSTAYNKLSAHVVFSGFVRDRQKARLLNRSDVFIMNSVSEPFGIVALEAAQRNSPVIVSERSGVKEVLDGALVADFWDAEQMAHYVLKLLDEQDHANSVVDRQHKSLSNITWDHTAEKLLGVYRDAMQGDRSLVSEDYTRGTGRVHR